MSEGGRFGFVGGPLDGEVLKLPRMTIVVQPSFTVSGQLVDEPSGYYELVRERIPFGGKPYYRWIGRAG
jgi:hypothetical protein